MINQILALRDRNQTTELRATPVINFDTRDGETTLSVWTQWTGPKLDRPITHGINFGSIHERRTWTLARRYALAIEAQVTEENINITRDVNGETYVQSRCKIYGKYAHRDLTKLGF